MKALFSMVTLAILVLGCGAEPPADQRRAASEGEGEGEGEGSEGEGEGEGEGSEGEGEGEGEGEEGDPPSIVQAFLSPTSLPFGGGEVTLCFERSAVFATCVVGDPFNVSANVASRCQTAFVTNTTLVSVTCTNEWGIATVSLPVEVSQDPPPPPPPPQTCVLDGNNDGIVNGNVQLFQLSDAALVQGCTQVTGDLQVIGTEFTDLSTLSSLVRVGGMLEVGGTAVVDLRGLENLQRVGALGINNNTQMTSFRGLTGLTTVDNTLGVGFNTALVSLLTTPPDPNCAGCGTPMESLQSVGGDFVWVNNAVSQCRIDQVRAHITLGGTEQYDQNNPGCN